METVDTNSKAFLALELIIKKLASPPSKCQGKSTCYHCRCTGHFPTDCKFRDVVGNARKKKGHISPCRVLLWEAVTSRVHILPIGNKKTYHIQDDQQPSKEESRGGECFLFKLRESLSDPTKVQVLANGKQLSIELDMGVALSIIPEAPRKTLFPKEVLHPWILH